MEKIALSLNEVERITDAAKMIGCTVGSLLREAASAKRLLYVALKPHSSKLFAWPSQKNPQKGASKTNGHSIVALLPDYAESLFISGNVDIAKYEAGFEPPLDMHYWMLESPQTVDVDSVFFPRSQLETICPQPETVGDDGSGSQQVINIKDNATDIPWLVKDEKDPNPEYRWYTPARYFARQHVKVDSTLLTKRKILAGKVVHSLSSVSIKKRGGTKPLNPNTVLKAFSNINLG